jgi:DNA (cytosine-5)-methyltransferase 1
MYVADLFSGAGGLTAGFAAAGFEPVVAVEYDRWAAQTYVANFGPHMLCADIGDVDVTRTASGLTWSVRGTALNVRTPEIDVLVGGPPCQGFSPLGRMTDWDRPDPRNQLWRHYVRILDIVRPRAFVIENVPELLKSAEYLELRVRAEKLGYTLNDPAILNAAHYGVPQARKRAIILGIRGAKPALPKAHDALRTVRDAIGDLPSTPTNRDLHMARKPRPISILRYKCVPAGGNRFDLMRKRPDLTPACWLRKTTGSTDVFGRMEWSKPAPTIRTEFFKPEKGRYLHPSAHRPITLREAARLQTFPDAFHFIGAHVQIAKQIGNAVPVQLAASLAESLKQQLAG